MNDDSPLLVRLGAEVRRLRGALGWSRRELSARSGISERFLAEVESGSGNPSVLRLAEVARALGTSVTTLFAAAEPERAPVIALLGLRGAGKSTVGPLLAERLGRRFVELDREVEREAGLTLTEIFEMHGEAAFRRLERTVLERLLGSGEPLVLATGGGVVTEPATWEWLRKRAQTVWLRAEPRDHWERVIAQGDTRPMANNAQAFQQLEAILAERERLYAQAATVAQTSGRTPEEVAGELAAGMARAG